MTPSVGGGQRVTPRIGISSIEDGIGLGRSHAVTTKGTQRGGSDGVGGGTGHRTREGLRLRIAAIPDLTPKGILNEPLRVPVVLGPDFEVEETALHTEFDTVGAGQFSSPAGGQKAPQLKAISLDALSLTWDAKWLTYPETTPEEVREELDRIIAARKPVELFAFVGPHGKGSELRCYATLRGLRRILRQGETDTRYYSMDWKQYRSPVVHRKGANSYAGLPLQYALKEDDTLRSIATAYYHAGSMWQFLASQNGIKNWGSEDPLVKMNRFKVGDKIKVPVPPPTKVGGAKSLTGSDNYLRIGGGS